MIEDVARAKARFLSRERADSAHAASLRAQMRAGGWDPDTTEPDDPQDYIAMAVSNNLAVNNGYLSTPELQAGIDAWEAALGGQPF